MGQGGSWIFVCSPQGKIYVGRKRVLPPRFQHSSFLAGGAALAAGQMDVDEGCVREIRAFSGHYRPQTDSIFAFLKLLHRQGVDTKRILVRQFKSEKKPTNHAQAPAPAPPTEEEEGTTTV